MFIFIHYIYPYIYIYILYLFYYIFSLAYLLLSPHTVNDFDRFYFLNIFFGGEKHLKSESLEMCGLLPATFFRVPYE